MKSKKLFAIVTLVMFMMTLLPVAAFAAESRHASIASINKTSVTADDESTAEITVYTYNANNTIAGGVYVYFAGSRDTEDFVAGTAADYNDTTQYIVTDATTGKGTFKVKSAVTGTSKIAVGLADKADIESYLQGGSSAKSAEEAGIIGVFDVTFTSPSSDRFDVLQVANSDDSTNAADAGTSADPYENTGVNGNGLDYYEVSFKLVATGGAPVRDTNVTFTANKTDVKFNKTEVETDVAGIAKVKVYADKPGTYAVKATAGDTDKTVYLKYTSNALYGISLVSDNNQVIAKDADKSFKFKLFDINGNQIKGAAAADNKKGTDVAATANIASGQYGLKFEAMTRPADAAMDEKIYNNDTTSDYDFDVEDETGYLVMNIDADELDTEGDYVIRAYFDNGKSCDLSFTVKKQGTPTKLTVEYDSTTFPVESSIAAPTVKRWDDANVSKDVSTNLLFVASDSRMYDTFNTSTGAFTTYGIDEKYSGSLMISVVDKDKDLTAVAELKLAKTAIGITATPAAATTETGQDAVVGIQVIDVDGTAVALGDKVKDVSIDEVTVDYYVISKPAGAIVSYSTPSTITKDMKEKGKADLKFASNIAGDVAVQIVVTVEDVSNNALKTFTNQVALKFGAPKVAIGAKQITMFIGATGYMQDGVAKVTDVAPFIKDGRTLVAVRPIADAFGAEIAWDAATQTVTLTRTDMTVTIVIGSSAITVVKDGVTSTVTADVPAAIEGGRTVLPFRAVGDAFGAAVSYDATTQSVSYQQ